MTALLLCLCMAMPDQLYQQGMALVKSGRLAEARAVFEAGEHQAPADKRFPIELAGLSYLQNDFRGAKQHLKKALRLDPNDNYANEFLGTLYFLDRNLEAALLYWNRLDKPRVRNVETGSLRLDPVLLDRAFAFSPATVLKLDDYRTTQTWLAGLDILRHSTLDLEADGGETFDVVLRASEKNGWAGVIPFFRGVFYQAVYPEFYNIQGKAVNWLNMLRWDAQKRRVFSALEGPFAGGPKWSYRLYADGRSETWNLGSPEDFRMEKIAAGAALRFVPNWRIAWTNGLEFGNRNFRNAPSFQEGSTLKYRSEVEYGLVNSAPHRFQLASVSSLEFGRMFSGARPAFAQLEQTLDARWIPVPRGSDYEMRAKLQFGKTFGDAPFDELFILGLERDNHLMLRAHAGTRNGKKGSAPIGRDYVLSNWEVDKNLLQLGLAALQAGPFLDVGRAYDNRSLFGSHKWLFDMGLQVKLQLPGGTVFILSYGRDLRSASNVFYLRVAQ